MPSKSEPEIRGYLVWDLIQTEGSGLRYSLLDYLVAPSDGKPFRVAEGSVTVKCDPTGWHRCLLWCGRYGQPSDQVEVETCKACLSEDLIEGTLQSASGVTYPVVDGIPRVLGDSYLVLVRGLSREWLARHRTNSAVLTTQFARMQLKTVTAFGEEWRYFSQELGDYKHIAQEYFDLLTPEDFSGVVLDAGCGMGRWALQVGGRSHALMAVDLSSSVEVARQTLNGLPNAHVVQADLHELPFRLETFDLIYSLGVIHHLPEPENGLRALLRYLKPCGRLLAYFYYALDNRPKYFHFILPGVSALRHVISQLPHRVVRWVCFGLTLLVYWPLIQFGKLLSLMGFIKGARQVPLYEFYVGKGFRVLFNDSVDRFGTAEEHRFSREQLQDIFSKAGFKNVVFSDSAPYWKILGCQQTTRAERFSQSTEQEDGQCAKEQASLSPDSSTNPMS